MLNSLLVAIQFLTRFPVQLDDSVTEEEAGNSVLYYAVVGLIIGIYLTFIAWITSSLDSNITAAIVLVSWIIITGALHLDGLADSADAWIGGYGDKEKTLAIMKDPYCGPAGVVSLLSILILKFALLSSLLASNAVMFLIMAPVMARFSASLLFQYTPYVRKNGIGESITEVVPGNHYLITGLSIVALLLFSLGIKAWLLLIIVGAVFYGLRQIMHNRIGGITGDTTGAMIEIIEVTVLFCFALFI